MPPNPTRPSVSAILFTCLAGVLTGMMLAYVSTNLQNRYHHRDETIANHLAILDRTPLHYDGEEHAFPNFYGRLLAPALMRGLHATGLSLSQAFLLTRIFTASIAVLCFILATGAWRRPAWAVMAVGAFALLMIALMNQAWEQIEDFLDAGFFALAVLVVYVLRERAGMFWVAMIALATVAAFNRESAAFLGIVAFFAVAYRAERPFAPDAKRTVACAALCLYAYLLSTLARSGAEGVGSQTPVLLTNLSLLSGVLEPRPFVWRDFMLAAIVFSLVPLLLRATRLRETASRLFLAAVAILGLSLLFGRIDEPRVFIPAFVIGLAVMLREEFTGGEEVERQAG